MTDHNPGGVGRRTVLAAVPAVAAATALTISTAAVPAQAASAAESPRPHCLADLAGQTPSREDR